MDAALPPHGTSTRPPWSQGGSPIRRMNAISRRTDQFGEFQERGAQQRPFLPVLTSIARHLWLRRLLSYGHTYP